MMRALTLLMLGVLGVGCATARTTASIRQTDADGFTESVQFETAGIVTWGAKADLQDGDLYYDWSPEGGQFATGGTAAGQVANDPMTALTTQLLQTLIERAFAEPVPSPELPSSMLPPVERGETADEWLRRVQQIEEVLRRFGFMAE